ncbi:Rsp5p-dependent ubiquitination, sorting of cargo proteins at the multivesicular body [Linnemannia zychae]|nr:Rsp5p-dependent ubiquitination, sorting of cargo proteins at the multivesicular body [Linnemannia zychae]
MSPLFSSSPLSSGQQFIHQDQHSVVDSTDDSHELHNRLIEQQASQEQLVLQKEHKYPADDHNRNILDAVILDSDVDDSTSGYSFDYPSSEDSNFQSNPTRTHPPQLTTRPPQIPTFFSRPPQPPTRPFISWRAPPLSPLQSGRAIPASSDIYYKPSGVNSHPISYSRQSQYLSTPTTYPYHYWRPTTIPPPYYPDYLNSLEDYRSNPYTTRPTHEELYPTFTPPSEPGGDSDEEDLTWLAALVLTIIFTISIVSAIRTCGQKAGWLTGSTSSSSSSPSLSPSHHRRNGGSNRGRRGYGNALLVPDSEGDPEVTPDRLSALSDTDRQAYDAAEAFQVVNPPNSVPTDISLSQYLSIQEKGVSAWEFEPSYDHQLYVHDRTELSFFDPVASVQTNLPLPKQQEVYYWEVKMFEKSPRTTVAIGVATKPYPSTRLPGWNRHSVGYFSNNGQKYCNSLWSGVSFGPPYFEGDVIGCGYRPRNGTIFFTRNGKRIDDAYTGYGRTNLFPTVGATGPCVLHVNFGQSGFVFVEANVKKWGLAPASGSLAPPPAYGSELGSILLEAAGSGTGVGLGSRMLPQRFTSSSSSGSLTGAGRSIMQSSSLSATRGLTTNGESNGNVDVSSPVPITTANMSAPPPNYSSLDRYGHPRTDLTGATIGGRTRADHVDVDTASITSNSSDESATLLLNDATLVDQDTDENV